MAKSAAKSKSRPDKPSGNKPPVVEIDAEGGDPIEPPPPELVEPDPDLTPEEAEQARREFLGQQRRPAGVGIFDRAIDPDRRPCRLSIRHQRLESRDVRRYREARFGQRVLSERGVLSAGGRQRAA